MANTIYITDHFLTKVPEVKCFLLRLISAPKPNEPRNINNETIFKEDPQQDLHLDFFQVSRRTLLRDLKLQAEKHFALGRLRLICREQLLQAADLRISDLHLRPGDSLVAVAVASIGRLVGVWDLQGGAFAFLAADGSVVTWGNAGYGGDSSKVQEQLVDVQATGWGVLEKVFLERVCDSSFLIYFVIVDIFEVLWIRSAPT